RLRIYRTFFPEIGRGAGKKASASFGRTFRRDEFPRTPCGTDGGSEKPARAGRFSSGVGLPAPRIYPNLQALAARNERGPAGGGRIAGCSAGIRGSAVVLILGVAGVLVVAAFLMLAAHRRIAVVAGQRRGIARQVRFGDPVADVL